MDFEFIADPPDQPEEKIRTGYCICIHCKTRVETGIVNLSEHWFYCESRIQKQGRSPIELLTLTQL